MKYLFAVHPEGCKEPINRWIFLGGFDNDAKLQAAAGHHAVLNIHAWGNYRYVVISGEWADLKVALNIKVRDSAKEEK